MLFIVVHVELSRFIMPWAFDVYGHFIIDSETKFIVESKF